GTQPGVRAVAVVGILPQQHDLDLVEGRRLQRREYLVLGRVDCKFLAFLIDELFELFEIRLSELIADDLLPAGGEFLFHAAIVARGGRLLARKSRGPNDNTEHSSTKHAIIGVSTARHSLCSRRQVLRAGTTLS